MSIKFSNNYNDMLKQIQSGAGTKSTASTTQDFNSILENLVINPSGLTQSQMSVIQYIDQNSSGWTKSSSVSATKIEQRGFTKQEANAIIQATGMLTTVLEPGVPIGDSDISVYRQDLYNGVDWATIEKIWGVDISWFYEYVGGLMIENAGPSGDFAVGSKFTVLQLYRKPKLLDMSEIPSELLNISAFPSKDATYAVRSDVFLNSSSAVTYNGGNYEVLITDYYNKNGSDGLSDYIASLQIPGNWALAQFIPVVKQLSGNSLAVNTFAAGILGVDYDAYRWITDGPETAVSVVSADGSTAIQKLILTAISDAARDDSITTYSQIETTLQSYFSNGIELNFSAMLTQLTMMVKVNLISPGYFSKDYTEDLLTKSYYIFNFPQYIWNGVESGLIDLQTQALSLGDVMLAPKAELNITRSEILALAGIGVTLLSTFIIFNVKSKEDARRVSGVADAFSQIKTIIVDVAVSGVVLTVLVETALIYSKTGSIGGTIAQILADGVILFVDVIEDLIEDLWDALKGEWAKFIAVIGSAAATIAGGEALIGSDLIAGSSEIAAGESEEGAEIGAGEITEGAEQEAGDVVEGFESAF